MPVVYFAHSYREADAQIVDHFGRLIRTEGVVPSLDPPSDAVNGAKLERHLNGCDGMVAVLTERADGVSPHILYELSMCVRARKPLLVFVEDTLPSSTIPARLLQRRFSRSSYFRQAREHRHAVATFKEYLADRPRYELSTGRRSCLFVGLDAVGEKQSAELLTLVQGRGYEAAIAADARDELRTFEAIAAAHLCLWFVDDERPSAHEIAGAARAALLPQIALTNNAAFPYSPHVPLQYQPVYVRGEALQAVSRELEIFEQEFIELNDVAEVDAYRQRLIESAGSPGSYDRSTPTVYIDKLLVRDVYAGNTGNVGATVHSNTHVDYSQVWHVTSSDVDMDAVARQLGELIALLEERAKETARPPFFGSLRAAMQAAISRDGGTLLRHLAAAGSDALVLAKALGLELVAKVAAEVVLPHTA